MSCNAGAIHTRHPAAGRDSAVAARIADIRRNRKIGWQANSQIAEIVLKKATLELPMSVARVAASFATLVIKELFARLKPNALFNSVADRPPTRAKTYSDCSNVR